MAAPGSVRRGLFVTLALALLVGVYLTAVAGPAIVVIGLLSMLSAVAYTGGPYPLGYRGLGDLFVMLFFGFVAVGGTTYVQAGEVTELSLWAAAPVGALATAILVVNNLRDRETDARAGKLTLAVRLGVRGALLEYAALVAFAYAIPVTLFATGRAGIAALAPLLTLPLGVALVRRVGRERGRALNPLLKKTALLLFSHGLLFALGLALPAGAP
jgi:1,4-dihydroxy-2-naphthoate octaprenyltransferase